MKKLQLKQAVAATNLVKLERRSNLPVVVGGDGVVPVGGLLPLVATGAGGGHGPVAVVGSIGLVQNFGISTV